ncbi:MAG: tyrosine-type recombinase/integrase [Dehalococcoidia bacterium]
MGSVAELTKAYLGACEVEGKSPRTIRGYRETLRRFAEIISSHELPRDVENFTVQDVYAYLAALRERDISRAYQHRLHREVKTFFSWCKRLDLVHDNAFARVPIVKLEQQIIQPFSPDEIRALLAAINRRRRPGIRNYALVLFLLDTGVRASECVSVRLDDVDWGRGRVRVLHGKGQKQRWVGLGEEARNALQAYISRVRGIEEGPLFLSTRSGLGLRSLALNTLLRRLGAVAGVSHVHPHRFRHTFATWAIRSQAREIDVQSLLGHSSLTMVQRYARTYSSEQAVQAHEQFSPVGQLGIG